MEVIGKSTKEQRRVQKLKGCVQSYGWGKRGRDSEVVRLYASNSGSEIDPEKPYAEFWMGTHDSGPSFLIQHDLEQELPPLSLKDWIFVNPNKLLGHKVVKQWGSDLPFLFKVLSVTKALSIQAHPDKELARTLHKVMPNVYKDNIHKPEMALAIKDFQALCGFISLEELKDVIGNVPEIIQVVGKEVAHQMLHVTYENGEDQVKSALRSIFTKLMSAIKEIVTTATTKLKNRLHMESQARQLTVKEELVLELERQYPNDVGVMSAYFLNHIKLKPGEALYLGANEPHSYISGDCIECMAASDNVVRAGLTPKYRDVKTLCPNDVERFFLYLQRLRLA